MRSKLELWKIVDACFDDHFETGLCSLLFDIYASDRITLPELETLENELSKYGDVEYDYFLGDEGDPKPRIKFIQKMIEKHQND